MSKNKLARFEENKHFAHLFQYTDYDTSQSPFPMKGRWRELYFKNQGPVVLELGCGGGEYTVALAERFPDKNFIGADRKGARLWKGCKKVENLQLPNVAFLRVNIEAIVDYFAPDEIDEIWITFPDPQPKKPRKRLTSPQFIARYRELLTPEGIIHLKTDSDLLYQYTILTAQEQHWKIREKIDNIYLDNAIPLLTDIQTFYEQMWLKENRVISYLQMNI
ncbi:MAG: tRNA (guanosine(46)-N7)-methyltransferase TrmB [Bacteroidales bacterium]|jgi:tRNA (guanine-N7-)-methyltransferase|nr:tRNA (guanosine(46)-N7)-methyltransferase TrmB [Bacteroidales bacterium]